MAPPKFDDIGKSATDLFKGFDAGKYVLTLKSKTQNGVAFKVKGTKGKGGAINGEIETSGSASGLDWCETWTTKGVSTEITKKDFLAKGTKFVGDVKFSPSSGFQGWLVKADYKNDALCFTSKLADLKSITATASVSPIANFVAGAKVSLENSALKSWEAKAGYVDTDYAVTSTLTSSQKILGSIYHTPQSNVAAGVRFEYDRAASAAPSFELVGSYKFDGSSELKTSVNDSLTVGFAYKQSLRKEVKAGWYATIDTKNLGQDAHKIGASLEFNH